MVKSQKAEALLPAFDIGRKVGGKIRLQRHRRAVVLCVVDVADFDGSLPRAALQVWGSLRLWTPCKCCVGKRIAHQHCLLSISRAVFQS